MKTIHWMTSLLVVVLLVILILPACSEPEEEISTTTEPATTEPTTSEPTQEPTTIKVSYTMPKGKAYGMGLEWFASELPERTDGRYIVETYPSNTLLSLTAAVDGLKEGLAEIGLFSTGMFATNFPLSQATTVPTVSMPTESVEQWMNMWDAWWEFYEIPEVKAEYEGMVMLWPYATDGVGILSVDKEIRCADDFDGMSIGAGGISGQVVTECGGAAVHLVTPETYMNLDKGVIQGAFLTPVMITDWGIHEIIDYYNSYNFGNGTLVLVANEDFWSSLPSADQDLITDMMWECAEMNAQGQVEQWIAAIDIMEDAGVTFINPTPEEEAAWDEACSCVTQRYIDDALAAGAKNPEEILEQYREIWARHMQ